MISFKIIQELQLEDPKSIKRMKILSSMWVCFLYHLWMKPKIHSQIHHQQYSWASPLPFCCGAKVWARASFACNRFKKEQNSKEALPASFAFPPSRDEPCGKLFVKLNLSFCAPAGAKQEVPQLQLHSLITCLSMAAVSIHNLLLHGQFIFKLKQHLNCIH